MVKVDYVVQVIHFALRLLVTECHPAFLPVNRMEQWRYKPTSTPGEAIHKRPGRFGVHSELNQLSVLIMWSLPKVCRYEERIITVDPAPRRRHTRFSPNEIASETMPAQVLYKLRSLETCKELVLKCI
ncbi:hypothetical protein ST47_g77 [Ascochyta rabiei]|uniref:Uncharacterized protein n=1 Tax=Didymella rabiei TaxID=5454 RepID=A0A163MJW5_DIDRA|nr:hypothetical protein ST47_g77 [Ascochyta rabiei]